MGNVLSLQQSWWWGGWLPTCKSIRLNPYPSLYTKINSKWIKDIRTETIKYLDKKMGDNHGIGLGNEFFAMTLKAQVAKTKMDKWGYIN